MPALGAGTGQLGVREPTRIACETLLLHLERTSATKIRAVTFYGYMLHEHMAVADEVSRQFTQTAGAHEL